MLAIIKDEIFVNYKTGFSGLSLIFTALGMMAHEYASDQPLMLERELPMILTGLGLVFARDAKVQDVSQDARTLRDDTKDGKK